jgi:NAD(P)-dependent dehydrogenase (short-subunit alcohol dehydrogenase family)
MDTSPEEWDAVMSNNLRSVFLAVKLAYPLLEEQNGAIVNVSSVHAVATSRNIAAYAASKGALLALTRALALEFGPDGVRVNAVLPGAVDTKMLRDGLDRGHVEGDDIEDLVRGLGEKHVMGRVGRPGEIGEAILFLADAERSSFMTGQSLVVDGGATARLSTE